MARLMRPLRQMQCPMLHHQSCCSLVTFNHILPSSSLFALPTALTTKTTWHHRNVHQRSCGLRLPDAPAPSDSLEDQTDHSDSEFKKSRNQKKREAKIAVRWAMDLASFSTPQIKLILRAASLEQDVFEAIMLVKRLGPDVREGKRRQFNYIGKLLRGIEPKLMDTLIQATKDGDHGTLHTFVGSKAQIIRDDDEETDYEEEEEQGSSEYNMIAIRWFDGLINKNEKITSEVYAVNSVDFDRQELRRLVRKVHAVQECQTVIEQDEVNAAIMGAKKSLMRFLHSLAKHIPIE
ncbi:DUF615 domain-containing protein [Cephalotus follicularis]|uniref:DUF615 domain-containing protein n=1 Tax=Cephalotus follicularis TaxID=3775 RepID=A0A1Q3CD38_CEPFO|nr:DUF615 domain-containing protein [Cephalotus follicularis]